MRIFIIEDTTAGNLNRIVNEQGLIDYANDAHFVEKDLTKPINTEWQVYACTDVDNAISILQADLFSVTELDFTKNNSYILPEDKTLARNFVCDRI